MKRKQKFSHKWFFLGLLAMVLAAPNATIIRYTAAEVDPVTFINIRFGIIALIALPFVIKYRKSINATNLRYALIVGLTMTIAVFCFVTALQLSPASYVSIITLITPIIFVFYSIKLTGDKVNNQAVAGVTLAALGAFVVVFSPIALSQNNDFRFYPLATLLALINTATFPLAAIYSKKANESGLKMISIIGISAIIIFGVSSMLAFFVTGFDAGNIDPKTAGGILYSALVVAMFARILSTKSYEHNGSAVTSSLFYVEVLLAIIIPIMVLNEKLSLGMAMGGALILLGVYVVEFYKAHHIKPFHLHRNH